MEIVLNEILKCIPIRILFFIFPEDLERAKGKENIEVVKEEELKGLEEIKNELIEIFTKRVRRKDAWINDITTDMTRIILNDIDYEWEVIDETSEGIIVRRKDNPDITFWEEDEEYHCTLISFATDFINEWKNEKGVELLDMTLYHAIADTIKEEVNLLEDNNDRVYELLDRAREIIFTIKQRIYKILEIPEDRIKLSELAISNGTILDDWQDIDY